MFPATDANVQSHRAGWLNRIAATQSHQLMAQVPVTRSFTPLRPNAGLVGRVPTPTMQQPPGSRPTTQQGYRTQKPVDIPQGPNSARGPAAGASAAAPPRLPSLKQDPLAASPSAPLRGSANASAITSPSKGGHGGASTFGRGSNLLASSGSAAAAPPTVEQLHDPLFSSDHDAFIERENAVVDEVNAMRRDPAAYAAVARVELRVLDPFVVSVSEDGSPGPILAPMNLAELSSFAAGEAARLADSKAHLEALENDEEKTIAAMREAWAAEDAERAKKKGKAPAPKKGDKAGQSVLAALTPEEIDAEREAQIETLRRDNTVDREATRARIVALQASSKAAEQGVKVVGTLVAKLAGTPPLGELERNRGLALAARDMADSEKTGSVGVDATIYTTRFGGGEGPFGQCTALGKLTVRETLLDLLLCLHDPGKRRGRHALLSAAVRLVGCGWRRNAATGAATSVIVAGNYAEFAAIASRSHLPLQDVRRTLPFATKLSANTAVRLDAPSYAGIEVIEPASHPIVTQAKYVRAIVRCPPESTICASVVPAGQKEPERPAFVASDTFVQRTEDGGAVEVHAAFPADGKYNLILYGQIAPPADGIGMAGTQTQLFGATATAANGGAATPRGFNGTMTMSVHAATGPAGDETSGTVFRRLGAIAVTVRDSDPLMPAPVFPTVSTDFIERRMRLESPLSGALRPDTPYVFRVSVPITSYKQAEVRRVEAALASAIRRVEGGAAEAERLEEAVAAATEAIAQADADGAAAIPAAQQEIAGLQKDMAKKKGKDLEKAKAALADAEERLRVLEAAGTDARAAKAAAEEQLNVHRRASRQSAAMRRRYEADRDHLAALTDRTRPLPVEIAVDDRRAKMPPAAGCSAGEAGTLYEVLVRTPKGGPMTVFIAGIAVAEYTVDPATLEWPDDAFDLEAQAAGKAVERRQSAW